MQALECLKGQKLQTGTNNGKFYQAGNGFSGGLLLKFGWILLSLGFVQCVDF